jgi:hypothetical protein
LWLAPCDSGGVAGVDIEDAFAKSKRRPAACRREVRQRLWFYGVTPWFLPEETSFVGEKNGR